MIVNPGAPSLPYLRFLDKQVKKKNKHIHTGGAAPGKFFRRTDRDEEYLLIALTTLVSG